jgi:hypothetical protein
VAPEDPEHPLGLRLAWKFPRAKVRKTTLWRRWSWAGGGDLPGLGSQGTDGSGGWDKSRCSKSPPVPVTLELGSRLLLSRKERVAMKINPLQLAAAWIWLQLCSQATCGPELMFDRVYAC